MSKPIVPAGIERTRERLVYSNKYLELFDDDVTFPSGAEGTYVRAEWRAPYGVAVLATTADDECVLVRQFNYASKLWMLQVPKGMGTADEEPLKAAQREFLEETGYESDAWREILGVRTDPSFSGHVVHLFLAERARRRGPPQREATETIAGVELVPRSTVRDAAFRRQHSDALTQLCWLQWLLEIEE